MPLGYLLIPASPETEEARLAHALALEVDRDGSLAALTGDQLLRTSGECLSAPAAQLERLPLRVDDGTVWVRL